MLAAVFAGGGDYATVQMTTTTKTQSERTTDTMSADASSTTADTTVNAGAISIQADTPAPEELDTQLFVKLGYELRFLFAVDAFDDPADISASKLVQFAFCHLYHDSLTDADRAETMVYRSASAQQIEDELYQLFRVRDVEIEQSDLYNSGEAIFEMWEPDYSADVFANATLRQSGEDYRLEVTYYAQEQKTDQIGELTLTIGSDDGYYIAALQ